MNKFLNRVSRGWEIFVNIGLTIAVGIIMFGAYVECHSIKANTACFIASTSK